MSHFTVLVVGSDPEKLLAPFDESIEVEPRDDEDLDPQKAVDWAKKSLTDPETIAYRRREFTAEDEARYQRIADLDLSQPGAAEEALTWYGYDTDRRRQREDGSWVALTTYNPDSKWDWYSLGGRWRGSLKVTPEAWDRVTKKNLSALGELSYVFKPEYNDGQVHTDEPMWVDQCRKGDLDLAGMMGKKREIGEKAIANLIDFISERGNPPSLEWLDEDSKESGWQEKKDAFWNDPWVKEFNKRAWDNRKSGEPIDGLGLGMGGWWEFDDFRLVTETADGRDRFLMLQEARGIPGYAFLDEEHGWMAPGSMGWFGMSSDDAKSRIGFYEARMAIVQALPEDALLSVYDCHI